MLCVPNKSPKSLKSSCGKQEQKLVFMCMSANKKRKKNHVVEGSQEMSLLALETLSLIFLFASVSGAARASEAATAQPFLVEPQSQAQLTLPEFEISQPDYCPPGASAEIVSTAPAMGTKVLDRQSGPAD